MNEAIRAARAYMEEGFASDALAHFIDDDHSGDRGISSPMSPDQWAKGGYISAYYTLAELADEANWLA